MTSAGLRKEVLIVNRIPWTAGSIENMPLPAPASRLLGSCCWGLGGRQERFAADVKGERGGVTGEGSFEESEIVCFPFHLRNLRCRS